MHWMHWMHCRPLWSVGAGPQNKKKRVCTAKPSKAKHSTSTAQHTTHSTAHMAWAKWLRNFHSTIEPNGYGIFIPQNRFLHFWKRVWRWGIWEDVGRNGFGGGRREGKKRESEIFRIWKSRTDIIPPAFVLYVWNSKKCNWSCHICSNS